MQRIIVSIIVGLIALRLFGFAADTQPRRPAPAFNLADVHGKPLRLDQFKDKALLVFFWATWDGPCKEQLPTLMDLHAQYSTNGFTVLGLSLDEKGPAHVREFAATNSVNFPLAMADYDTVQSFGSLSFIPTLILIAPDHTVVKRYESVTEKSVLETDLKPFLKK